MIKTSGKLEVLFRHLPDKPLPEGKISYEQFLDG